MSANPHKGEVEFEAGGELHTMKFGTNAQCAIEADFGCGLDEVMERINADRQVSNFRRIFRLVLVGEYTLDQVGDIMDEITTPRLLELFNEAVSLARAKARESGPRPRKASGNGAGRTSSSTASPQV